MFTGIVTDVGEIESVTHTAQNRLHRVRILCHYDQTTIADGASIACNGTCLTVVVSGVAGGRTLAELLRLGTPVLGLCYGMQLLAHQLGRCAICLRVPRSIIRPKSAK